MAISRISQSTVQAGFPKFNNTWDGFSAVGAMELIKATTLSASSASVEFNNIPGTYSHLQLRQIIGGTSTTNFKGQFNGDTGNNYAVHYILGDGSGTEAGGAASTNHYANGLINSTSNSFAVSTVDILDYSSTSKNTTTRTLTGYDNNGNGLIIMYSGVWLNTAAVNSITIFPNTGTFIQYSSFTLYGIK